MYNVIPQEPILSDIKTWDFQAQADVQTVKAIEFLIPVETVTWQKAKLKVKGYYITHNGTIKDIEKNYNLIRDHQHRFVQP